MPDYEKMYLHLFNAVTDALKALADQDLGQARAPKRDRNDLYRHSTVTAAGTHRPGFFIL